MRIRFAKAARKHRIGQAHALYVMGTTVGTQDVRDSGDYELEWYGPDDRGVMLTVIGVLTVDRNGEPMLLIIHVMPDYE